MCGYRNVCVDTETCASIQRCVDGNSDVWMDTATCGWILRRVVGYTLSSEMDLSCVLVKELNYFRITLKSTGRYKNDIQYINNEIVNDVSSFIQRIFVDILNWNRCINLTVLNNVHIH